MLKDNLNTLIMQAMKEHNQIRVETLRSIKSAIQNYETAKNAKPYDEAAEISILKKMSKERAENFEIYSSNGRQDLATIELEQKEIIQEFLPKEVTEYEIRNEFDKIVNTKEIEPIKKNMGVLIKKIKSALPAADGKMVAEVVTKYLK